MAEQTPSPDRNAEGAAPSIEGYSSFSLVRDKTDFSVWRAVDQATGTAVEVVAAHADAPPAVVARAVAVHRHVAKVDSPGLQKVLRVCEDVAPPCFVLEPATGKTLYRAVRADGPLDNARTLRLARQIGVALGALNAESPFAIRNLKPENIVLDAAGNAKICDYTLAIFPGSGKYGVSVDEGSIVGTPQYLSPEQAEASAAVDSRTDLYALGAVLYFACTGKVPFDELDVYKTLDAQRGGTLPDPRRVRRTVSQGVARIISLLMMKDPANRHGSFEDFVADVRSVESGSAPNLLVPDDARSTVPVAAAPRPAPNPAAEGARPAVPVAPPAVVPGESSGAEVPARAPERLRGLAADDAAARKASPPGSVRFLLWLLLCVWLVVLGHWRMNNPLGLAKFAGIGGEEPDASDLPAGQVADSPETAEAAVPTEGGSAQAGEAGVPSGPAAESAQDGSAPGAAQGAVPPPPPAANPAQPQSRAADFAAAAAREDVDLSTWAPKVLEQVRKGDFAAAAKAAKESGTSLGASVAAQLAQVPPVDAAVAREIMRHEGREITLTYMGKARQVSPISADGTTVTTSFNGRTVKINVASLSAEEKLRWLEDAQGEAGHVQALSLALQTANDEAIATHAILAGPTGRLLGK